ncbi:hypothetical protein [Lysobacter sp. Root983]|uniref:hypothetical protein n=1 Tax=Lysobacter sp. Root983 TaxID=1736613 RepID=UPI000710A5CE|nr:hypothetical protein [Lysobacter sp. Root983]KRD74741.1 hypothetical protein ASE43_16130 [Lysobacter sp. Root983]
MQGVLFVTALLAYAGTYTLGVHFARGLLGAGPEAFLPRLIGLTALALATLAFVFWAQVTFVDSQLAAMPEPVAHARYAQRVLALSVAPAPVIALGALILGWRSKRAHRAQARQLRERPAAAR